MAVLEVRDNVNKEVSNSSARDPLERIVQEAYTSACHRSMTPGELKAFIEGVVSYDGLYEEFLRNPQSVCREIFSSPISGNVIVPCYTVELRQVLKNRTLVSSYKIIGFSNEIAKRYLSDYPVFLVLDSRTIFDPSLGKLEGAYLFDNELHFGDSLVRVLVRDRGDSDTMQSVLRIVSDEATGIEVGVVTDAPGISNQKVAQIMAPQPQHLKKFVVNVPTLQIEQEVIRSENEIAALQEALTRKWQQTGNPHKDPKYTAEYWLTSPMVQRDDLVREAETATYIVKADHNEIDPLYREASVKLKLPLQIEADEQEIFDLLLQVNQQFGLGLTFRVAGGWVRDRALGVKSKDIDIALDKMTGAQFCKYITKLTGKQPAIIAADEQKSKSLETATINLGSANIPIDFVNLRKEVYEPGSRVPKMTFGTADEDAERRDFTLNALFYNVNAGQIEDLTGKGLKDLADLVIRTPLDPKQTFADDPLRVFRALRFFAKFKGSTFAPETLQAIHDPEVQSALDPKNTIETVSPVFDKNGKPVIDAATGQPKTDKKVERKISEERILVEWQKLHKGPQASDALRLAHDSGLWNKVFMAGAHEFESDVPAVDANGQPIIDPDTQKQKYEKKKRNMANEFHPFTMDQNNAWHIDNVFEHTMKVVAEYDQILRADGAEDDERARLLAAAFMHDLGKLDPSIIGQKEVEGIIKNTYHGHEDISAKAAEAILRGIKASNDDIEHIKAVVQNHMIPHNKMTDKQINKMIRNLGRSLVKRIVQHAKADAMSKPGADEAHYDGLLNRVHNAFAVEPHQVRPVIDGRKLMEMFPQLKPQSGFIKEIQDRLQDMKDGYPQITEQEALVEVENMREEIVAKFQNYTPVSKVKQQQQLKQKLAVPSVPTTPTPSAPTVQHQASTLPFNLAKQASEDGSVEMLCGKVGKHKFGVGSKSEHQAIFMMTDDGEEFKLRRSEGDAFDDPELDKLVGKRVCGKGMLHKYLFIMSEYSVVNLDKDEDIVQMKRRTSDDMTQFDVGDKVRHRQRGLAFEQITGRVDKIDHGIMYIKWDGVRELEVFNLSDPVAIYGILQKL